jgi:hypothetical protein
MSMKIADAGGAPRGRISLNIAADALRWIFTKTKTLAMSAPISAVNERTAGNRVIQKITEK